MAILDDVIDATALIRGEAPAIEAGGRLTPAVLDAMRAAGVFRMTMSHALGGPELDPLTQLDVLEQLAYADGSAGWCGMINSDGGYVTAFLEPTVAKEMYPSLDLATSVIANPTGQARREGDEFFTVRGQWAFASGSPHCDWFFVHCLVFDGDDMVTDDLGLPVMRVCAVPARDVEVLDTWHTTGLNGTASHDIKVANSRVPLDRTLDLLTGQPVDPSPLYQWRWMFFVNLAAVPLGIARAALEEAADVATTKITMPSLTAAREDMTVQYDVARATTMVRAAKAYLYDSVGELWDILQDGRLPVPNEWANVRLAIANAAQSSKDAVGLLYSTLGTTGVYRRSALDRYLRDVTTLAQHVLCQTKNYTAAGRVLLGLEPNALAY